MKITNADGSITDTDKMSDVDSMLVEKAEELRNICVTANRELFLTVECTKNNATFWNFRGASMNEKLKTFQKWLDSILKDISKSVFRIAYKNSEEKYIIDP